MGIHALLLVTDKLCNYFNITQVAIHITCDGLSALQKALWDNDNYRIHGPFHNILGTIMQLCICPPIQHTAQHV
jgi:hypothetical protein